MSQDIRCSMCSTRIRPGKAKGLAYEVVGWVTDRNAGTLLRRQMTGRWAHVVCLNEEKIVPEQMTLEDFLGSTERTK